MLRADVLTGDIGLCICGFCALTGERACKVRVSACSEGLALWAGLCTSGGFGFSLLQVLRPAYYRGQASCCRLLFIFVLLYSRNAYRLRWHSLPRGVLFARQRFRYSVRLSALLFLACSRFGLCECFLDRLVSVLCSFSERQISPTVLFVRLLWNLCAAVYSKGVHCLSRGFIRSYRRRQFGLATNAELSLRPRRRLDCPQG